MLFRKKSDTATTGRLGETYAAEYLIRQGYEILEKNYRKQFGEVDIIARDRGTLVFIEVKTRRSRLYGAPQEAVDFRKQRQLSRIAQEYLISRHLQDAVARFDVIGITLDQQNRPMQFDLIRDAFDLVE
ncbi:MAG: YraN family protein [Desulfobulbaceae bacterium]|jgi:putative endonuclease|nr:YraN family protein [Desulfobulbaceae bacterium]